MHERASGRFALQRRALPQKRAILHGHCHQKAFGLLPDIARAVAPVPEMEVEVLESTCRGMAGRALHVASVLESASAEWARRA